ncbi:MAG: hypothetical protein RLZ33_2801, partial [Bacteroidota bacterium]
IKRMVNRIIDRIGACNTRYYKEKNENQIFHTMITRYCSIRSKCTQTKKGQFYLTFSF